VGKHTVTVHGAPRGRKAYLKWGAAWFPKGIVYDTVITTPVPCSPQHDTYHLGLTRAPLASLYHSNPQLGIPSTPVTASHVTQGKLEYEST